jgi:hypothetical protein
VLRFAALIWTCDCLAQTEFTARRVNAADTCDDWVGIVLILFVLGQI